MRDGFTARASCVKVGTLVGIEDGERGTGEAFGGDVDVRGPGVKGGGGREEERLGKGPFA